MILSEDIDGFGIPMEGEDEVRKYQDKLKVSDHGHLVVVTAPDGKTLSKPFLRIQEVHEGKRYHGSFVSLSRFKKWYKTRHKNKMFTYYEDWLGFNFPGSVVTKFVSLYEGKMNNAEKALLSKLDLGSIDSKYIIGTLEGDSGTLLHEVAHALFYLDTSYREQVLEFLSKMQYLDELQGIFGKSDYHNSVWLDEMQAYLIAGIGEIELGGKPAVTDTQKFDKIVSDLKNIFNTHIAKYPELKALI